ncbi:putative ORFan [Tupanvirus deep ocean]|uniref:ORFan n=2 Tax=Tupanvirus TaxID=2094720 RepID=A0AC62A724_9VIRU|nr:putative ORFan [Tupanvirus deep ocean]QKU33572.1 putative ORFan [Tupanvirus deep ocean]
MICGLPKCKKAAIKYGVCDFHKAWSFVPEDNELIRMIDTYKKLMMDLDKENENLREKNINVVDIQSCWDNGNINIRKNDFPEHFIKAGTIMEEMDVLFNKMQKNYDPKLVYNCTLKARHQCGPPCTCVHCKLKIKNK